jgi:predicted DNA-binding ribbon-helix-helix protein
MKSDIVNRWVTLGGRNTSVTLEDEFWNALCEIAERWRVAPFELIEEINANREQGNNLSSAIRVFVLQYFRDQSAPQHQPKTEDGALKLLG